MIFGFSKTDLHEQASSDAVTSAPIPQSTSNAAANVPSQAASPPAKPSKILRYAGEFRNAFVSQKVRKEQEETAAELEELRRELADMKAQKEAAVAAAAEKDAVIAEMQVKQEASGEEIESLREDFIEEEENTERLEQELASKAKQLGSHEEELTAMDRMINELAFELISIKQRDNRCTQERDQMLEAAFNSMTNNEQRLLLEAKASGPELVAFTLQQIRLAKERVLDELDMARKTMGGLQSQMKGLQDDKLDLEDEISEIRRNSQRLQDRLGAVQGSRDQYEQSYKTLEAAFAEMSRLAHDRAERIEILASQHEQDQRCINKLRCDIVGLEALTSLADRTVVSDLSSGAQSAIIASDVAGEPTYQAHGDIEGLHHPKPRQAPNYRAMETEAQNWASLSETAPGFSAVPEVPPGFSKPVAHGPPTPPDSGENSPKDGTFPASQPTAAAQTGQKKKSRFDWGEIQLRAERG